MQPQRVVRRENDDPSSVCTLQEHAQIVQTALENIRRRAKRKGTDVRPPRDCRH